MSNPKIILLNGTSSSGKTTLAKALQAALPEPYLHVCIDAFEDMMPRRFGEPGFDESEIFGKTLAGMHGSIAALAAAGSNLIVDHVMIEGSEPANWVSECLEVIAPYDPFVVGVHCPLAEAERRERERGDRGTGLAEWQNTRMHKTVTYDFEVDTSLASPEELARSIIASMEARRSRT